MSDLIHTEISANGIDFVCLSAGDPRRPLALCLHGYPDSAHTWRHLLPELAADGFHAVAPFMRGYAPSSLAPEGVYQTAALGMDANALHEHLDADGDAVVIGHDWGALAAYAAVGIEPARWRRIVGASVLPGPVSAEAFFRYDQLKMSWYLFFQTSALADMVIPMDDYDYISRLWADWSPGYDADDDVARFLACVPTPDHLAATLGYYRQTLDMNSQADELAEAQAAALAMPTIPFLYLHGRDDGCFTVDLAPRVAEYAVGDCRVEVIENAGHFLQLEQPRVVNDMILEFVTG